MDFKQYVDDQAAALNSVPLDELNSFISELKRIRETGATLWVAGNGGSSASASHAVADFVKTSQQQGGQPLKTISVSELLSLTTAYSNDVSYEEAFSSVIRDLSVPGDAILLISVSGTSPNLMSCEKLAKEMGLTLLTMVGAKGSVLAELSDHSLVIASEDYQTVENAHMSLIHWFVKELW